MTELDSNFILDELPPPKTSITPKPIVRKPNEVVLKTAPPAPRAKATGATAAKAVVPTVPMATTTTATAITTTTTTTTKTSTLTTVEVVPPVRTRKRQRELDESSRNVRCRGKGFCNQRNILVDPMTESEEINLISVDRKKRIGENTEQCTEYFFGANFDLDTKRRLLSLYFTKYIRAEDPITLSGFISDIVDDLEKLHVIDISPGIVDAIHVMLYQDSKYAIKLLRVMFLSFSVPFVFFLLWSLLIVPCMCCWLISHCY